MANSTGANGFNLGVGGLAVITTGISLTLYSQTYLPGRQIKILDDLLEETWAIYEKSEVDGLLPEDFQVNFKERYTKLEMARNLVRERTYRATTLYKEYIALLQGVSKTIMGISDDVKILRGRLVTTSEQNRRPREANAPVDPVVSPTECPDSSSLAGPNTPTHKTLQESEIYPPNERPTPKYPSQRDFQVVNCRQSSADSDSTVVDEQDPSPSGGWGSMFKKWRKSESDIEAGEATMV